MGMNKQSGNMYDWISHTWNPIGGECPHKCGYCYVNPQKEKPVLKERYSGPPRLIEKEMTTNLGQGNAIFVGNMADMFAKEVPLISIYTVFNHCEKYFLNRYLFQSKNPMRFLEFIMWFKSYIEHCPKDKAITLTTTIESDLGYKDSKAPDVMERADALGTIKRIEPRIVTSVTIEPIMRFSMANFIRLLRIANPDFVNIGADSKGNNLPEPSRSEIFELVERLKEFTEVRKKHNIERLIA